MKTASRSSASKTTPAVRLRAGQVAEALCAAIRSGKARWQLDPVPRLAETYGVSLVTMHRALGVLKKSGDIRTVPGRGSYVNERRYRRTHRIGLVVGGMGGPLTRQLFRGVMEEAQRNHQSVILKENDGDVELEQRQVVGLVQQEKVDGVIVWPTAPKGLSDWLNREQVHYVWVPDPLAFAEGDRVVADDAGATAALVRHLLSSGCQSVLCAGTRNRMSRGPFQVRASAYRRELKRAGCAVEPLLLLPAPGRPLPDVEARLRKADAVFCVEDAVAAQIIGFCARRGIRVPRDLKVTGYNNSDVARMLELTSVEQHFDLVGQQAVRILLQRMEYPEAAPFRLSVPSTLIFRTSTDG
jgi:LacI family transcriptional regulator